MTLRARGPIGAGQPAGRVVPVEVLVAPSTGAPEPTAALQHDVEAVAVPFELNTFGAAFAGFHENRFINDDRSIREATGAIALHGVVVGVVVVDSASLRIRLVVGPDYQ